MPSRGSGPPAVDAFHAISDETRRSILVLLRDGERPVGEIASRFPVTRPAISQHLRVLLDAGLVEARKEGRERLYRLAPARLGEVVDWLAHFDRFWDERLAALTAHLLRRT